MIDKEKIEAQLERLISEYESLAEEYFQEINDLEQGDLALAKAQVLKEFLQWMREN